MSDSVQNLVAGTISTAPSPASSGTTMTLSPNSGVTLPTAPFTLAVWPAGSPQLASNTEYVRVTANTGNSITAMTRAYEGPGGARSIVVGDSFAQVFTKKNYDDLAALGTRPSRNVGSLVVIGHSYTFGIGTYNSKQVSMIAKLQSLLGVTDENVENFGESGQQLTGIAIFTYPYGAWSAALQYVWPDNAVNVIGPAQSVISDPVIGTSNTLVVVHGVNDMMLMYADTDSALAKAASIAQNLVAGKQAFRMLFSRHRAGSVYGKTINSSVAFSWDSTIADESGTSFATGHGTNVASVTTNSGPGYRNFVTSGHGFQITIPTNFTGGTVAICLIGGMGAVGQLTSTIPNTTDTSIAVTNYARFPNATLGNFVIKIDTEEMLVTTTTSGTWTVVRGVNGTTKATHTAGAAVVVANDTHNCVWTGTVFSSGSNPSHPNTPLGGQGSNGVPVGMVVRYHLAATDAGKTIIGTLTDSTADGSGGSTIAAATNMNFDSWWIESAAPAPQVATNIHDYAFGDVSAAAQAQQYAPNWNSMLSAVVAEFTDGYTVIADVYSRWWSRNGHLTGALADGTGSTSIQWTPNDTTYTPAVGRMMSFGGYLGERVLVTAATWVGPYWDLTITRDPTYHAAHNDGDFLGAADWMYIDELHPNILGHAVYAQTMYDALQTLPAAQTYQIPATQGNWANNAHIPTLPWGDDLYIVPAAAQLTASATAVGTQVAHPIYIPMTCIITEIGVETTSPGSTGGTIRFGIYMHGTGLLNGKPAQLLKDFGEVANTVSPTTLCGVGSHHNGGTDTYLVVRPGWYWLSYVQYTAAATIRGYNAIGSSILIPTDTVPGNANVNGVQQTGISGALVDWGLTSTYVAAAGVGRIHLRVRTVRG